MSTISGLVALAKGVQGVFDAQGIDAVVATGVKQRTFQINQGPGGANRVVFIPGVLDPSQQAPKVRDAGVFSKPRHNHAPPKPREIAWWHKTISVSIWAVDTSNKDDEFTQMAAVENLLEVTVAAIHRAVYSDSSGVLMAVGLADLILERADWVAPPVEMGFGQEVIAYYTHGGPLFDFPVGYATPQPVIARNPAT